MKVSETSSDRLIAPAPPEGNASEDERERLRAHNRVRPLQPDEEGLPISRAPNGVYGFTYAPATETPVFASRAYHTFEVHKLADGRDYVVGYVSTTEAANLDAAHGAEVDIKLYPEPAPAAPRLLVVATHRLHRSNARVAREEGNPVLFRVYPE